MAIPEYLINKIMLFREPTESAKLMKCKIEMYNYINERYGGDDGYTFTNHYFECFHGTHVFCPKCKKYAGHPYGHDFTREQQPLCKDCLYGMLGSEEILQMTAELTERTYNLQELQAWGINVSDSESEN